jgi:hypothetical protein
MSREDFVDECLVANPAPTRFLAELIEHSRIDANCDELAWFNSEGWPTDAPHGSQLPRR